MILKGPAIAPPLEVEEDSQWKYERRSNGSREGPPMEVLDDFQGRYKPTSNGGVKST